jgi:hypothetical protein
MTVSLVDYPLVTGTTTFDINITGCVVLNLIPVSTVLDIYDIGGGPHTYTLNSFD